jgi:transcriptional regulator with XRE-family HTH domain
MNAGEPTPRGKALLDRLARLKISDMSDRELEKVLGINRATWSRIETGLNVRPSSFRKAEESLDAFVEEHGLEGDDALPAVPEPAPEIFELTVSVGALDLNVTAKGRPEDADLVREQVARIVMDLMRDSRKD